jgi:hypothetical protein
MNIEHLRFADRPERITEERFDCIWIRLSPREAASPLESQALQWLDWKLLGQISRYLLKREADGTPAKDGRVTFIPTMRRLPTPYLAIEGGLPLDADAIRKSCAGLGVRRLLYFCEESAKVAAIESSLGAMKHGSGPTFPESIVLGSDS